MSILTKLKNNLSFIIPSIFFGIWLIFLLVMNSYSSREVIFYNALPSTQDVSTQYSSEIPLIRYLFEPFTGLVLFSKHSENSIYGLLVLLVIIRVVFLLIEKVLLRRSQKKEVILDFVRNTMNFLWKYLGLALAILVIVIFSSYYMEGERFVDNIYKTGLQVIVYVGFIILAIKIFINVFIIFKPGVKLRVKPRKRWKSLSKKSPRYWAHQVPHVIGRELRYAISTVLIVAAILVNGMTVRVPLHEINTTLGDGEILLDMHVHTIYSDGWLDPEERVDWYIDHGIKAAAFTDHHAIEGALIARDYVRRKNLAFTVIIGQEYTTNIHCNIYGIEEVIVPIDKADEYPDAKAMSVSDMIQYVKANGGYVTVNHYTTNASAPYKYDDLLSWGIDGFEIVNGPNERTSEIRDFCIANNLAALAGSDTHGNEELDAFMKVKLNTTQGFTLNELFTELKKNTHDCIYIKLKQNRITIPESMEDIIAEFEIAKDFFNYMLNLDDVQYLSWILWSAGIYAALFFGILKLKRMKLEKLKEKIVVDDRKGSIFFKNQIFFSILIITITVIVAIITIPYLL
ncbi:MAG: PHP domain-containing protein [Candidatus Hodarchaeota archaeon]